MQQRKWTNKYWSCWIYWDVSTLSRTGRLKQWWGCCAARLRLLCKKVPRFLSGCMQLALRAKDSSRRERVRPSSCETWDMIALDPKVRRMGQSSCKPFRPLFWGALGTNVPWVHKGWSLVRRKSWQLPRSVKGLWQRLGWDSGMVHRQFWSVFLHARIAMAAMPLVFCKGCHLQ